MNKISCMDCKNIADMFLQSVCDGNYCECILLHRFVDWYYWNDLAPDDCPKRQDQEESV